MKKALIQLHAAVLLWGFTGVLGKLISLDAPVLVWYRMALTAVIILGILLVNKRWMRVPQKDVLRLTVIGGLMAVHWVAFYAAIKYANASIALVCLSTSSIFTSLLDPLVNKTKYNSRELALGCLALAGMYLIYHFQQLYVIGIVLGVIAAMLSSVFTILNKRIADRYPSGTMVFYEMTTGFAIISLLLPLFWYYTPGLQLLPRQDSLGTISTGFPGSLLTGHHDWIWLLFMALCCTVWAQTLALNALKKLSSFTITLTVNMEPVYGILLAVIVFREDRDLSLGFFAGMGLICLSVVLQMYLLLRENSKLRKLRTADAAVVAPPDISQHTDKGQRQ